MRRPDLQQAAMFGYITLERRIPADHPLRAILPGLGADKRRVRPAVRVHGRESIPPERADPPRPLSQQKRKLIERVFGWGKLHRLQYLGISKPEYEIGVMAGGGLDVKVSPRLSLRLIQADHLMSRFSSPPAGQHAAFRRPHIHFRQEVIPR